MANSKSDSDIKRIGITINNFKNELEKAQENVGVNSLQFTYKGTFWHVEVQLRSKVKLSKSRGKEYVGVYLWNDNDQDFDVDYKFVMGDVERKSEKQTIPAKNAFGPSNFLTHEKSNASLVKGNLVFQLEFKVYGSMSKLDRIVAITEEGTVSEKDSVSVPLKIHHEKLFSDFRIICSSGKPFMCHKAFLVGNSPVLKRMFEGNMKEVQDGEMTIEDYEEIVVENFVRFFYTGRVDSDVLMEHAVSFMDLGEKYEIAALKYIAEQTMINNLSVENVLSYLVAGDMYRGAEIKTAAKLFFAANRSSLDSKEVREALEGKKDLMFELLFYSPMEI